METDTKSEKNKKRKKSTKKSRVSTVAKETADEGVNEGGKDSVEGVVKSPMSPDALPQTDKQTSAKDKPIADKQMPARDKRGTFVVKMTDVLKESTPSDKRGTFVVRPIAGTESSSEEASQTSEGKNKVRDCCTGTHS